MASSRLYFFGRPHFEHYGRPVELTPAKAVALLAYLAASRAPQPRERLYTLLWADSAEEAARKNLRNTLWTIRKQFDPEVILDDNGNLALAPAVWVDVHDLEAQVAGAPQAAVERYQGPFLDAFSLAGAPEFELWAAAERERLGQLYLRALATLVEMARQEGQWREVIDVARRALAHDDLQEPMAQAVMEAYARLGERAEALRQYDTLQAALARELGVEPLAETEALREAILSGDLRPTNLPEVADDTRPPSSGERPCIPFIGREAERAVLDEEWQRVMDGGRGGRPAARVVLLTGEVGIGKSRLWQEWAAGVGSSHVVLASRCLESTQELPFAPLVELFSGRRLAQRLFTAPSPVAPIWLAEVARLLPGIRATLPPLPDLAALPPGEERRRVFEAFTQCLLALEARPLIFFMDDLHWADRATLDWLDYVIHRLQDVPFLLVAAYRPEDVTPALAQLVASWGRQGLARRVHLERLSDDEAAALLAALVTDLEARTVLAHRLLRQSAGNPYFLIELARILPPGDVPPVLQDVVRARLDRLPETGRQVLQAAAVLDPDFDFHTLRRASGRGEEETLDALDALLDAVVLVEQNGGYSFAHPLVATVARNDLSGARRAFLHRRAAAALEASHAGRLPQMAGRLAEHYAGAGEVERAAHYAGMAAERALTLAAPEEAIGFYQKALAWRPAPALHMGLGRAYLWQGRLDEARDDFLAALSGFEAAGDRAGAGRASFSLAETYFPLARFVEARQWMGRGLNYYHGGGGAEERALAQLLLGAGKLEAGGPLAEVRQHLSEAARLAAENNLPDVGARSHFVLGNVLAERGDLAGAVAAFRRAIAFAAAAGDYYQEVLAHNNAAYHALFLGDLAAAREHVQTGLQLAESRALRLPLQYLYSTRGEVALAEHQWAEAEEWFERGLAEAQRFGNQAQAANYRANLGLAARGRGDLDEALGLMNEAAEMAAEQSAPHLQTQIDLWLAELHLAHGERAAAGEALARAEARLAGSERRQLQAWAQRLRQEIGD